MRIDWLLNDGMEERRQNLDRTGSDHGPDNGSIQKSFDE